MPSAREVFLAFAAIPFIYYVIAVFSSWRYFRQARVASGTLFTPPISILKPIKGLDPDAYENLASFCRQDYPEYEIVFCVDADDDKVRSVLAKLTSDFPQCRGFANGSAVRTRRLFIAWRPPPTGPPLRGRYASGIGKRRNES